MDDLIRLSISNERLQITKNHMLQLTGKEIHYLKKVMRVKVGQEIFIVNGEGSLWKGIKNEGDYIKLINFDKPIIFNKRKNILLGLAVVLPKSGFEEILKMSTELGIDLIQPLYSDRQIKRPSNNFIKEERWNLILNESVEQCERLWKPNLLHIAKITNWIESVFEKDLLSISVTRDEHVKWLRNWLDNQKIQSNKKVIIWNVIGPEGGWSKKELEFFYSYKIQLVKLSENILRTSTAALNASSLLNNWRDEKMQFLNYK